MKDIQVAAHQRQPWFDKDVKARHKVVQNREQMWQKYPRPDTWKAFQVDRNIYNRLLIYKKRQLISKQVTDSKDNTKKLYKLTAYLAGINMDSPLTLHDNDKSLTNHFADYFITRLTKFLRNSLEYQCLVQR